MSLFFGWRGALWGWVFYVWVSRFGGEGAPYLVNLWEPGTCPKPFDTINPGTQKKEQKNTQTPEPLFKLQILHKEEDDGARMEKLTQIPSQSGEVV